AGTPNAYTFVKGNSGEFANAGSFGTFIYVAGATANKAVTVTFPTGGASSCFVDDFTVTGGGLAASLDSSIPFASTVPSSGTSQGNISVSQIGELLYEAAAPGTSL